MIEKHTIYQNKSTWPVETIIGQGKLSKQKHMACQNHNWSMQIIKIKTHGMSECMIG